MTDPKDKNEDLISAAGEKANKAVGSISETVSDVWGRFSGGWKKNDAIENPEKAAAPSKEEDGWGLMDIFKGETPSAKDLFKGENILPLIAAVAGGFGAKKLIDKIPFVGGGMKSWGVAIAAVIGIFTLVKGLLSKDFNNAASGHSPELAVQNNNDQFLSPKDIEANKDTYVVQTTAVPTNLNVGPKPELGEPT